MISEEIKLLHLEILLEDLNGPYDGQAFFLAEGVVLLRRSELSAPESKGVSLSVLVRLKEHASDLVIARIRVYGVPQALARQSKNRR